MNTIVFLQGKVIPNKVEHAPPKKEKTESIFGKKIPITQGPNKKMTVTRMWVFLSKGAFFPFITFTTCALPGFILIGTAMKRNKTRAILAIIMGTDVLC